MYTPNSPTKLSGFRPVDHNNDDVYRWRIQGGAGSRQEDAEAKQTISLYFET